MAELLGARCGTRSARRARRPLEEIQRPFWRIPAHP